jgi:hypothetical protein
MAENTAVKYPQISVKLSGIDGNAFSVLAAMFKALRMNGVSQEEIDQFKKEATSGNYDHLLQTCMKWVNIR